MNEEELQKLKSLSISFRKLTGKVKLLSLSEKAKNEYEQNKLQDCENTCKNILKEHPNNSSALRGLGCVMQAKGKPEIAIKYYIQALENSKNKEIEYTLIGTVYYNENRFEEAIKYYNLAIEANDEYDSAYEGRNQSMLENHLQILDMQDNLIKRNIFK
jgi:tetratricopeptide (TPR) repeat protein